MTKNKSKKETLESDFNANEILINDGIKMLSTKNKKIIDVAYKTFMTS